jgi:hypothetical protein
VSDFTLTLLRFTDDNWERCSHAWLATVVEWVLREQEGRSLPLPPEVGA